MFLKHLIYPIKCTDYLCLFHQAILPNGQEVEVKKLSKTSKQGFEEFKNEVTLAARLQHVNFVRVLGFCIEREEQMLVYIWVHAKQKPRLLCLWLVVAIAIKFAQVKYSIFLGFVCLKGKYFFKICFPRFFMFESKFWSIKIIIY